MSNKLLSHLPWIAPTVAIVAVGSGFLDRINISFSPAEPQVATAQPVAPVQQVSPAEAAIAEVATPAPAPVPQPQADVSAQLAALLTPQDTQAAPAQPEVTRSAAGFSLDILTEATDAALDASAAANPTVEDVSAPTTFASPAAILESNARCVQELRKLAGQAKVYFPSGGLTAEDVGLGAAQVLGILAQQCPGVSIVAVGHSDPSGNPVINRNLSLSRAEAVIARVAAAGVDTSLFSAVGRGSDEPSNVTGPQSSDYYDRRVEFEIVYEGVDPLMTAASFAPVPTASQAQMSACAAQLEASAAQSRIEYQPRGMTVSDVDLAMAIRLGELATNCPEARLRIIGNFSDELFAGEDPATARLRASVLRTKLVAAGIPEEQVIMGAPSEARPVPGFRDSRIDFEIILEDS